MELIAVLIKTSAHLLAAIVDMVIDFAMTGILAVLHRMGSAAWIFPLFLVFLTFLTWKKRFSFNEGWTMAAEIFLPFLCGAVYFLIQEQFCRKLFWLYDEDIPLSIWSLFLLLGAWVLYLCLCPLWKDRKAEMDLPDLERVEKLLRKGLVPAGILGLWCLMIMLGIFFLSTVGILFSLILGGLISEKNALWEYISTGLLAGLGILYALQLVYLTKAALLLEGVPLEKESGNAIIWMLVPGFAWLKAYRLSEKVQRKTLQTQAKPRWTEQKEDKTFY